MLRQGQVAVNFRSDGSGSVVKEILTVGDALGGIDAKAKTAGQGLSGFGDEANNLKQVLVGLGQAVVGTFSVAAIVQFATRSIVEFQKVEAQIVTLTGSYEAARDVIARLRADGERTNLNINESAQAWIRLRTQGIDPTVERLSAIGNIAAQTGRTVEEVANAFGQAARGQFRQLAQLGATFREENDQLVVRYVNGTEQIINSSDDAVAALERLGNVDFAGAKVRDAQTLSGAFDDLTQAASELAVTLGGPVATELALILRDVAQFVGYIDRFAERVAEIRRIAPARDGNPNSLTFGEAFQGAFPELPALAEFFTGTLPDRPAGAAAGPSAEERREQAAATNELSKATQELVDRIVELTAAEGKSRVETLELAKAKALAKAATDADREAVAKAFDGYIAAAKATESREKAERATATALQTKARADREAAAEAERNARAVEQQRNALQRLLDQLYGLEPATAAYRDQVAELVALFQAGAIDAEQFNALLARAQQQLESAGSVAERLTGRPDTYADLAQRQVDEFGAVWENGVDTLGDSLRGIFRQIFGAAGDDIADLLDAAFNRGRTLARDVRRDSQALGRGFELDPDFVGPATAQGGTPQGTQNIGTTITQVGAALAPQLAAQIGGNGRNAQLGAQIGQVIGSIFGPVGSIVGSILGGLLGGSFDGTPRITVSGNPAGQERTGRSVFGTFGASTRDTDLPVAQVIEAVRRVDAAIAQSLSSSERNAVSGALRNFSARSSGDDLTVEEVLRARVARIIETVEPAFAPFLNAIDDVEERVRQFQALRVLQQQIEDVDRIAAEALGDPLEQQEARFAGLQERVTKAGEALAAAIDAQDFADAAQASQDYQRAVLELAQAQITTALQLQQALDQLDRSARAFDLNLLQRLANLPGGDPGTVTAQLRTNIDVTREGVLTADTFERSLEYLNEFVATVDAWLQSATQQVRTNLQNRLRALDEEEASIIRGAQARQGAFNIVSASFAASLRRDQTSREALEEQVRLAQQWVQVLEQADGFIDRLRFGNANPIGAQAQFANLSREADSLFARFTSARGGERVDIANRLLEILNQQQQVGTSLFDRPSDESVALYNQILERINAVRDVARPEAERSEALQRELAELQRQTVGAVNTLTDATYLLTEEERQRLDEIAAERRAAEAEAQAALDEINAEARGYYQWARTTGQDLQRQQRDLLQSQLNALTGGMPVQQFIAQKQSEARDALYAIRDSIRDFLRAVQTVGGRPTPGNGGNGGSGGGGGSGGSGGGNDAPPPPPPTEITFGGGSIVVNVASGDPAEVAAAVRTALRDELPVLATAMKRELQTA